MHSQKKLLIDSINLLADAGRAMLHDGTHATI